VARFVRYRQSPTITIYDPHSYYGFSIGKVFSSITKSITKPFEKIVKEIGDVVEDIADIGEDIVKSVGKIGGDVFEFVGDIGGDVFKVVGDIGEGVIDLVGDVGEETVKFVGDIGEGAIDLTKGAIKLVGEVAEETYKVAEEALEQFPKTALLAGISVALGAPGASIGAILTQALSKGLSAAIVMGYMSKKRKDAYEKYKKELEKRLREQEIGITLEAPLWFYLILNPRWRGELNWFRARKLIKEIRPTEDGLAMSIIFKGLGRAEADRLKKFLTDFANDTKAVFTKTAQMKIEIPLLKTILEIPRPSLTEYERAEDPDKAIAEIRYMAELDMMGVVSKDELFATIAAPAYFVNRWQKLIGRIKNRIWERAPKKGVVVSKEVFKVINEDPKAKKYIDMIREVVRIRTEGNHLVIEYPAAYDSIVKALVEYGKKKLEYLKAQEAKEQKEERDQGVISGTVGISAERPVYLPREYSSPLSIFDKIDEKWLWIGGGALALLVVALLLTRR